MYPVTMGDRVNEVPRRPIAPPRVKYETRRPILKWRSGRNFSRGVSACRSSLCFAASARRRPPVTARQLLVPATSPMRRMPPKLSAPDVEGARETRSNVCSSLYPAKMMRRQAPISIHFWFGDSRGQTPVGHAAVSALGDRVEEPLSMLYPELTMTRSISSPFGRWDTSAVIVAIPVR